MTLPRFETSCSCANTLIGSLVMLGLRPTSMPIFCCAKLSEDPRVNGEVRRSSPGRETSLGDSRCEPGLGNGASRFAATDSWVGTWSTSALPLTRSRRTAATRSGAVLAPVGPREPYPHQSGEKSSLRPLAALEELLARERAALGT
jgi:hypothetical protein